MEAALEHDAEVARFLRQLVPMDGPNAISATDRCIGELHVVQGSVQD